MLPSTFIATCSGLLVSLTRSVCRKTKIAAPTVFDLRTAGVRSTLG